MEITNLLSPSSHSSYHRTTSPANYSISASSGASSLSSSPLSTPLHNPRPSKLPNASSVLLPPLRETFGDILSSPSSGSSASSSPSYSSPHLPNPHYNNFYNRTSPSTPLPVLPSSTFHGHIYKQSPMGGYIPPINNPVPINAPNAYIYDNMYSESSSNGNNPAGTSRKRRQNLPKNTTDVLLAWLKENLDRPYPNSQEKSDLVDKTGLTFQQLDNWFINARRRKVKTLKELRNRDY